MSRLSPFVTPRLAAVAGAVLILLALETRLPSQAQTPTFRQGANYVRVDMYPTRADSIVTDLRADEVELLEDGVPQKIEQFELVKIPPGGPEAARIEPNSIRAGQQAAADPRARVFVIFFDSLHVDVQTPDRVRLPLRRFLDEALGPDDLVAVMSPGMSASDLQFTRRTAVLDALLNETGFASWKVQPWNNLDPTEEHYQECYPSLKDPTAPEMILRRREQLTFAALEDLVTGLGELREERKTVFVITSGWFLFNRNQTIAERHPTSPPDIGDRLRGGRGSTGADLVTSTERTDCARDLVALSSVDNSDRIRRMAEMANRRNVSFYPIAPIVSTYDCDLDPSQHDGLDKDNPQNFEARMRAVYGLPGCKSSIANLPRITPFQNVSDLQRQTTLRSLAEDTDGVAIVNTANVSEPMQRIIADTSSYYLLGYQSTNGALDGKYRKITVRVKRPGVQVRARHGYRALSAAEMRTAATATPPPARAADATTRAIARLSSGATRAPLLTRTSAWAGTASGDQTSPALWVTGEIGAELRSAAAWRSGVRARLTLLGSDSTLAASTTAELSGTPPAFSLRFADEGRLKPGTYSLRIALTNSTTGDTLSDTVAVTIGSPAASLGEPLVFRRGLGAAAQPIATADSQFRRSERLRLELPTTAQTPASARVLDAQGKPVNVPASPSSRADASGRFNWVVVELPLSPFAAGDYALEVTQGDAAQVVGFRVVN
jgi:VWFA-related protein